MQIGAVDYGKRYWFLYFWLEAVSRAGQVQMLEHSAVAQQADKRRFEQGATSAQTRLRQIYTGLHGNNPEQKLASLEHMKDDKLCDMLTQLLRIGFRGVMSSTSSKDVSGAATHASNILSCCSFGKDTLDVQVGWRAEDRPPADILKRGGWKRQVDVAERARQLNMDKKWHPYHQKDIKKYLWFRAGKNIDNCFYSVLSVGHTFQAVLNFPEIDETTFSFLPHTTNGEVKAVREWSAEEKRKNPHFIATVKTSTEERREFLASTTYAYMFLLKGLVLDTAKASRYYGRDTFPEEGVAKIGVDDIYACWPIVRVFHEIQSPLEDEKTHTHPWVCGKAIGFTAFVQRSVYLAPYDNLKVRYSLEATRKLEEQFHIAQDSPLSPLPAFTCAWRGTGEGYADARVLHALGEQRECQITYLHSFYLGIY